MLPCSIDAQENVNDASRQALLFDLDERRALLEAMPESEAEWLCGKAKEKWRSHRAVTTLRPPKGYGTDPRVEPFARTVMQLTSRAFAFEDQDAASAFWRLLDRWADGGAMTKSARDPRSARYSTARTMLPVIVGISLFETGRDRQQLADVDQEERRRRVEKWLDRLVTKLRKARDRANPSDKTYRNNHALLYASVIAAWGAYRAKPDLLHEATKIWFDTLAGMRPDGSLPLETERGARALWYQRQAIASLIFIAEVADRHGQDLYQHEADGKSIHTAIRFLIEAVDDPSAVLGYASANINPGPYEDFQIQDLGFMRPRGHERHYMAWFEIYKNRFPERGETQEIERLLTTFSNEARPMIDEYSGGNLSCFFANPN